MAENSPTVLALDFDGVICDGLIEYFQTAWRTYCQIWLPSNQTPSSNLAESFYRLRPVIETGWEMPILIKAMLSDITPAKIEQDWNTISHQILRETHLAAADISQKLDRVRDEWIATDLAGWLSLHRFYPGVVERLRSLLQSSVKPMIITTKEGRFVQQLLQQQGVQMPAESIIGKESQRPKPQVLRELIAAYSEVALSLWFVEDRLKTLQVVQQQPDLDAVQLFLADWGYNTQKEREAVRQTARIHLLSLSQFAQEFSGWL
ncbi:MAG: HAD hydrolase-like protein [Chroococcidiopsidaceae cyanobacterium CP_BM_ER_R8_30]|nr:HAD hydrolase-like protein [Chroococcidiopsidaceae cyanobacterium CP_BM_ER_R8_30]